MNIAIEYIKQKCPDNIKIGIVLGSGLDAFCNSLESKINIAYNDIPEFRQVSVKGHKGEFVSGIIHNHNIICANGRFHYYEGYKYNDVAVITPAIPPAKKLDFVYFLHKLKDIN